MLCFVVELVDEELTVGPIHRLISGLPDGFDLRDALSEWFEIGAPIELDLGRRGIRSIGCFCSPMVPRFSMPTPERRGRGWKSCAVGPS